MKITSFDIIKFPKHKNGGQTPVLVRINTDEGIYGYGEAGVSIGDYSLGCIELLKNFGRQLIGRNPLDNDVIYYELTRGFWAVGNGGVIMGAISAVDAALWDIKGKYFNVPIYVLLGGKHRDRIRAYASQLQNGWKYDNFIGAPGDLSFLKEACHSAVEEGYDCIKIDFVAKHFNGKRIDTYEGKNHLLPSTVREIEQKFEAVREVVGENVEIILENHCITSANTAIQFGKIAEKYNPMLLEEAADPLEVHEFERIHNELTIPLATGERNYTRAGYLPLLERGLLDVIQPDLGNCGGITECRKIADLAQSYGATVQTHTCNTPLSVALALQFEAAIPNFIIHEHHTTNTLKRVTEQFIYDYQPVNGYFEIPDLPGIGNEPTPEVLAQSDVITVK